MKIDWAFMRNSCATCAKTRNYLEEHDIEIEVEDNARKTRLEEEAAWDILSKAEKVLTARGQKIRVWNPAVDSRDEILADAIGRSGNLRAPTLQIGNIVMIGFNEQLYQEQIGAGA
jgi:arsenate reductase-like glutaredoxin family protein